MPRTIHTYLYIEKKITQKIFEKIIVIPGKTCHKILYLK